MLSIKFVCFLKSVQKDTIFEIKIKKKTEYIYSLLQFLKFTFS